MKILISLMGRPQVCPERVAVHRPSVPSASDAPRLARSFGPEKFTCRLLDNPGRADWLEAQMENIYYHKRAAIQEHNVSANKDMLTIRRRRRQLPFKIDGNSINPPP